MIHRLISSWSVQPTELVVQPLSGHRVLYGPAAVLLSGQYSKADGKLDSLQPLAFTAGFDRKLK